MRLRLTFLFFLYITCSQAQVKQNEILSVLLTKFANNVEWSSPLVQDSFVFGLATRDTAMINTFVRLNRKKTIKNLPIKVERIHSIGDVLSCNAFYLGAEENYRLEKYWDVIDGHNILIVTKDMPNLLFSMINIEYSDMRNTFSFVVNKSNLTIAGLKALPSLVLIGGTEVDVRQLYKSTKEQLELEQSKVDKQKKVMDQQLKKIASLDALLEKQSSMLTNQLDIIQKKEYKISNQTATLDELNSTIRNKEDFIDRNKVVIQSQTDIISRQERIVSQKESELERLNSQLKVVSQQIFEKQSALSQQESQLAQKEEVISNQKIYLWLAMVGICFAALIISFIYYAYRSKSVTNRYLDEKNVLLLSQQSEITKQSAELQLMNQELQRQSNERQDTLEKLKEAQTQLVQAEKMASLGTLTAGIAHEINNPINFITSGVEGLKSAIGPISEILMQLMELPEEARKHPQIQHVMQLADDADIVETTQGVLLMITNIETGAERASEIIQGLNAFSRTRDTETALTDIKQNIESTLLLLNSELKNRIKVQKFYGQIPLVECLPGKINQVFMNIINNAAQSITGQGTMVISTEMSGTDHVKIRIKDSGKGISDYDLSRVFEPFYTTKSVGMGTGLGLAISYSIVKQHNGTIDVRSERGVGTEFSIKLPVKAKLV